MNGGTTLRAGASALALLLLASVPVAAQAAPDQTAPSTPAPAKDGPLSPRLAVLAGDADADTQRLAPEADSIDGLNEAPDGRLYVNVRVAGPTALAAADALPGTDIEATTPDAAAATLAIPVAQLGALAAVPGIVAADEVPEPYVASTDRIVGGVASTAAASTCPSGTTVSQGSAQMKVPSTRATYDVDGTGVKIGIISTSFGADRSAAAAQVRAGELPGTGNPCGHTTPVQIVADTAPGSDEGRAMAQIVHDLAPGAKLLFADAGASQIEMANHVRALRDAGAQVIVDDIGYFDSTMYQDGYLAAAVDEVVADGVTYLSAAGNENLTVSGKSVGSYETQAYRPTTCPSFLSSTSTCHDFNPGSGVSNQDLVTIPAGSSLLMALSWNQPSFDVDTDLDLFLLDDSTGEILDAGGADNPGSGVPAEWAGYANDTRSAKKVRIVVANYGKVGTPRFKMVLASPSLTSVQWNTPGGGDTFGPTLFGHAASPSAIAVGANTTAASPTIETYSSRGPATLCWEPTHGTAPSAAIPGCTTKTIDILGTDGVATTVNGFESFYGTSAAAPHVAAVAALMKQYVPCALPADIRAALQSSATPLGAVDAGGSGRTNALAALGAMEACGAEISAPPAPTITSVSATSVQVTVNLPAQADHPPFGYELELVRPGGEVVTTQAVQNPVTS
ncbi:MAG: S8 family serine peptidase, partial [Aquihabitans sp.]